MLRFIKNNIYALVHFCSWSGRDSRQTFCDIYKGFIVLALLGVFLCAWRNTLTVLYIREYLVISEAACWILTILFELFLVAAFVCATIRRWQDLDIRIPKNESVKELIQRPRFWQVLSTAEGSNDPNQYGPAPKDNPVPLLSEEDLRQSVTKELFVDVDGLEDIK